jgi:hypothetical protein
MGTFRLSPGFPGFPTNAIRAHHPKTRGCGYLRIQRDGFADAMVEDEPAILLQEIPQLHPH